MDSIRRVAYLAFEIDKDTFWDQLAQWAGLNMTWMDLVNVSEKDGVVKIEVERKEK